MKNVLEFLERSSISFPDKIALSDDTKSCTYSELLKKSKAIGTYIARKYVNEKNRPVVVLIERNIESIIMFMGVVYSGNFYVPIDRMLPPKRIQNIWSTLNCLSVVSLNSHAIEASKNFDFKSDIYEDMIEEHIDENLLETIRNSSIDIDPLYSIFTSGSTGVPKGVLISHRSVIDLVESFSKAFDFSCDDVFGNQAPFDFDVSTKDIYNAFKYGASINVIPQLLFSFPVKLIEYMNEKKITVAIWAVSALCIVANLKALKNKKPEHLKQVLFSGEIMPVKVLNYWQECLPEVSFVNLYGPTEITCNCTYFKINRKFNSTESIPIGKVFDNSEIILLNEKNEVPLQGELGEICVRGTCLALGYYNNPEKSSEVFIQNPLNKKYSDIIYRTGDLAYVNENDEYVYSSRKDFQIKHMGHRIELSEIEIAVNSLPFIKYSCCIYDEQNAKIFLFYQADSERNADIITGIGDILPRYMFPNKYIYLEEMPMNSHSKIDRSLLKERILNGTYR